MPKRVFRKQSILLKYAALFLIVLLVPLTVVSIFFVPASGNMLRERVLADKRAEFSVYSESLNRQIEAIISCSYRLSTSDNVYFYRLSRPTIYGPGIISDIRTHAFSCALLSDIYIVSPKLPFAYSSFSTYSFGRLADRLTNGAMNADEYEAFLQTLIGERMTVLYGDDTILLYYHLPVSDLRSRAYIVFELSIQMLSNYLSDFPQDNNLSIVTETGLAIYDSGREVLPGDYELSEIQPVLNWTFRFTVPKKDIEQLTRGFRMSAFGLLLTVVCLGGLMVGGFAYFSYKPLKNLRTDLETMMRHGPVISDGDEIQVIRQMAMELYGSAQALMGKGRDAYKNFILLRLIRGVTEDYHREKERLSELGLFIETEYCLAVVIYYDAEEAPDTYTSFWEEFAAANEKAAYAIFGSQSGQIIALVFGDCEHADAYLPFLERARDSFAQAYGVSVTIGVGLVYPDIESVPLSYMQAVMAYEYRSISDHERVLLFTAGHKAPIDGGKAFGDALDAFRRAALERSPSGVSAAANRIVDYVSDTRLTVHAARAACSYLAQAVSMVLYDLPYPAGDVAHAHVPTAVDTPARFAGFVQNLRDSLCARISECELEHPEPDHAARQALSYQISDYIDKNFHSNQLSVVLVAKQFGLSSSYVSRAFREEQGKTILEYLTERRIASACELLRQTDKSIETIVTEIGYIDASSFIRKFKKLTGVTPGEYRKRI